MTKFDPQRRALFRKIALGLGLSGALALTFPLKGILSRLVAHDIYKDIERGRTIEGIREILLNSPYPEGTYFWGLAYRWDKTFRRRMIEVAVNSGEETGFWEGRWDKWGFLDKDRTLEKPPNTKRVFVIGDSNIEGSYVAPGDSFCEKLETKLNKKHERIEVINGAKGGMNLFEYILMYQEIGRLFHPDEIIFMITLGNDFSLMPGLVGNFLEGIPEKGYAEYGQVVYEISAPDDKPFTGTKDEIRTREDLKLELRIRERYLAPDQPFKPRVIKADADTVKKRNNSESMIKSLPGPGQGAIQWLDMRTFGKYGLFEEQCNRVDYCFWRLRQILDKVRNPPNVYFVFLPSAIESPSAEVRPYRDRIDRYLNSVGFPEGKTERDIEARIKESMQKYLSKHNIKLIEPRSRLEKTPNYLHLEDLHYNDVGMEVIAEEVAKQFSF